MNGDQLELINDKAKSLEFIWLNSFSSLFVLLEDEIIRSHFSYGRLKLLGCLAPIYFQAIRYEVEPFSPELQLEIYSRCYSQQPLVIQGAGAGNDTTAAGVLADILDIQDLFP